MENEDLARWAGDLADLGVRPKEKIAKSTAAAYWNHLYAGATIFPMCLSLGGTPMMCADRILGINLAPHVASNVQGGLMRTIQTFTIIATTTSTGSQT